MDFLDGLQSLDKETRDAVFKEFSRIDPSGTDVVLQEKIFFALLGVVSMKRDFEQYRLENPDREPLEEGQHPHDAHYGPSTPNGAEKFVGLVESSNESGTIQSKIGQSLVVRTGNAIFYEMDGSLCSDADTFLPLIKVKGIHEFTFVKDNSSRTLQHAVDLYRAGGLESDTLPPQLNFLSGTLLSDAKNYATLARIADQKGEEYYQAKGLDTDTLTPDQKLKLFVAVEDIIRESGLYSKSEYAESISMLPDLHDEYSAKHYAYLKETGKFVRIPSADEGEQALESFYKQLPGYEAGADKAKSKSAWQRKAEGFVAGYTEYLAMRQASLQLSDPDAKVDYMDMCADSRTNARMFVGSGRFRQSTMMYVYRSAGNPYFDSKGNLTKPAQRHLGMAALSGGLVTHTGHGNCGAIGFAWKTCEGESGIPHGFVRYGEGRQEAYRTVLSKGNSSDEIIKRYTEETGIPFKFVDDCLAFQSPCTEIEKIRKIPGAPGVVGVFQHTGGPGVYFENVNSVKGEKPYIQLPYIKGLEKLVLQQNASISGPSRTEIVGKSPNMGLRPA